MILVTGGTGFIGSHLLDRLAAGGEPVRALVRRKTELPGGIEGVPGDLETGEGLAEAVRGADLVIHIAGVIKALKPSGYYRGNAHATENLARAAAAQKSGFVHISSLAVCGPSPAGGASDEDVDPHPVSHYGKSKLEAERIVRALIPDAVILRPPVVYGPRDLGVLPLLKAISRGVVVQISGAERWFSMIYVHDLVDGILTAMRNPQASGRTYFLSHPQALNWSDLGDAASRLMMRKPVIVRVPQAAAYGVGCLAEVWSTITRKPGMVSRDKIADAICARWVCDTRRASAELGFDAKTPLETGLLETLAWYKEAGWIKY